MPSLSKLYTMQEASQHNTKEDCWVVIEGKLAFYKGKVVSIDILGDSRTRKIFIIGFLRIQVYDVTSYLDEHPGGDEVVLVATGKDATDEFEDAGHSKSARELMEKFYIGELHTSPAASSKNQATKYSEKVLQLTEQYWAIPAAVLGISVVVGFLYLRKK